MDHPKNLPLQLFQMTNVSKKVAFDDVANLDRGVQDCIIKRSTSENDEHRRKYHSFPLLLREIYFSTLYSTHERFALFLLLRSKLAKSSSLFEIPFSQD
jgi:hypothetical protein